MDSLEWSVMASAGFFNSSFLAAMSWSEPPPGGDPEDVYPMVGKWHIRDFIAWLYTDDDGRPLDTLETAELLVSVDDKVVVLTIEPDLSTLTTDGTQNQDGTPALPRFALATSTPDDNATYHALAELQ
ncbi:hypothetical protein ACIA6C_29605 [Streptomyces sp. NPDC051578]|uniref:hypothetical protein n=1 Tax=Streptomyces sp. NPDC051578 TaxID=3365662 RepID=UPI003797FF88